MEEILKKINELANILNQKLSWVEKKEADLFVKEDVLNKRADQLADREVKVLDFEKIMEVKAKSEENIESLRKDQIAFEKFAESEKAKIEAGKREVIDLRAKYNADKQALDNGEAMLRKEWEELKKEKEQYRRNIKEEMLKDLATR